MRWHVQTRSRNVGMGHVAYVVYSFLRLLYIGIAMQIIFYSSGAQKETSESIRETERERKKETRVCSLLDFHLPFSPSSKFIDNILL